MTSPKAGQVWSWCKEDLVYLVKQHGWNDTPCWSWIDLTKGQRFRTPLTVGQCDGWELLVDV